jgi:hypothetical protein
MSSISSRLFAAMPDAISAAVYLTAWLRPALPGADYVNDLILAMFLQVFVIFAGLVYYIITLDESSSRLSRLFTLTIMCAATVFIMINVLHWNMPGADHTQPTRIGFDIDRPGLLFTFLWFYASHFASLLTHPSTDVKGQNRRMGGLSLLAFVAYVAAFLAAIALPLPPLGLTPDFVATLQRGDDMWGTHVYMPVAFGVFYFAAVSVGKFILVSRAATPRPRPLR